jgi:hypothetical protein
MAKLSLCSAVVLIVALTHLGHSHFRSLQDIHKFEVHFSSFLGYLRLINLEKGVMGARLFSCSRSLPFAGPDVRLNLGSHRPLRVLLRLLIDSALMKANGMKCSGTV